MNNLECLPNEIFIEIFQYFNIKELFQAFNNLNYRFNRLIQSLNNLVFKFYDDTSREKHEFLPYVDTLVIYSSYHVDFKLFENIHHLNLIQIPNGFIKTAINSKVATCLEDLSIKKNTGTFGSYIIQRNLW